MTKTVLPSALISLALVVIAYGLGRYRGFAWASERQMGRIAVAAYNVPDPAALGLCQDSVATALAERTRRFGAPTAVRAESVWTGPLGLPCRVTLRVARGGTSYTEIFTANSPEPFDTISFD